MRAAPARGGGSEVSRWKFSTGSRDKRLAQLHAFPREARAVQDGMTRFAVSHCHPQARAPGTRSRGLEAGDSKPGTRSRGPGTSAGSLQGQSLSCSDPSRERETAVCLRETRSGTGME